MRIAVRFHNLGRLALAATIALVFLATPVMSQLLLDDPLQGSTSGVQDGGTFVSGGWQVNGDYNSIFWHLPYTVSKGAAEFYVTGVAATYPHKTEHFHMYDYNYGNADGNYDGYRNNPYKHFLRKTGTDDAARNGSCEIVYAITPNYFELDTSNLAWSSSTNYKMRLEWGPDGPNSRLNVYRDGGLILSEDLPGTYAPTGHSVRIGCSPRRANEGSEIGAKYSYLKVWDMNSAIPGAPTVSTPANGETVKSNLVFIKWTGDPHDRYQVRICTADNPDVGIVWDSGEVLSSRDWAWTGALGNMTNYYVFAKLGSVSGWSGWSAAGRWLRVDSGYNGSNNVLVQGNTLRDNDGPFLGIGFTYMRSLQRCKYDRNRWHSDMAAMASMGFNYQRILSEVDWAGLEILPVASGGLPAWPDYWAQFDYDIDTAYDTYGIRTEVTIFASDAVFPNDTAKYAHVDNVLAHCNARSEKVVQIEVVNEGWQNGFPDEAVTRDFCQYMADRTSIPVSITCPVDRSDAAVQAMYSSGPADIATVHFDRNLGSSDGHWGPVIDCWRMANLYPGVPPVSSNEPIGSGSSVSTEDHPNHLCAAGVFAWIANLPMYVYHSRAGTTAIDAGGNPVPFENTAGFGAYRYLKDIIPPDVASWIRNDGKELAAPFTAYSNGQANKYWTDVGGATSGCHRNIGGRKGIEFICFAQGVLGGGLTLEARQQLTFRVYDPLTGAIVTDVTTKNQGEQIVLPQGNEIYIIKGAYGPNLPAGGGSKTLTSKGAGAITIDGSSSDWNLSEFTTKIRGGQAGEGDTALVGWDAGSLYYGSYGGVLPTNAADHTAKVYSRNGAGYLYFLVRCDDNDIRYPNAVDTNWANDCVEFYIDPENDGGSAPISNSASDVQLVIDANNQKNVYMATTGYAAQILGGVTSTVVRDGAGWWLEARISKTAIDPDATTGSTIGLDFNFRDNDNNNDAALTTIYTWNDASYIGFPSKIPNNWGDCFLDAVQTPYSGVISVPGIIQAENYDVGGQNISFSDTTPGNGGAVYRSDDVDIEPTADIGGGYNIGWVENGEWMEYTINVAVTGDYSIKFRVASGGSGGSFRARLDGADLTGVKDCADTGGWQNWTTIIAPAKRMTAGQHILRFCHEGNQANINYIDIVSNGADAVSEDLGVVNSDDGMSHPQGGDGDSVADTIGGHNCRRNVSSAQDFYMYFTVADAYAYQGNKPTEAITIDYFDAGTGSLTLQYDALSSNYKVGATAYLTNTNTWKTYTWQINDAYFGNRQNGASDFRIAADAGQSFYIDTVTVYPGVADTTAPGNVTGFTATPGDNQNILSWTNPTDPDLVGVKIMFKTTGYPTSPTDGTQVYDSNGTSVAHNSLTNGVMCYYKAFAHDAAPNYASGVQAAATPVNSGPPANVTNFTATPGNTQISLSWTNPAGGFTGVKIMFKTTGYPTGPADGTQVYDGSGTSATHTSLTNGTTYYYKAFAHDEIPSYASGVQASAVPTGPVNISNSTFDADINGWTATLWKRGESYGTMAWTSGAGNPGGAIRTTGVGATDSGDRCTREGGDLTKTISTVGYHGIQVAYDLRVNTLGGNYTGAGAGACAVDHSVIDEQIAVSYSTNGGSTWTEAEYLLRAALLASYQTYGRRAIDLSAITACDNNAGFTLKFRWQVNTGGDLCDLDNITVSGMSDGDVTPPGQVTGFTATSGAGQNTLAWTNPGNSDFAGTMVRYKTGAYPTSITDGTQVCYKTASPGSNDSYIHTGLTNGTRCYYSAFARDAVPNYSSATNANAVPAANATIAEAEGLGDGQVRALRGNVVSAVIGSSFYIQDPLEPWGVKVTGASASLGQEVDVIGVMGGQSGERSIDCTGNPVTVIAQGPIALPVRSLGNKGLGGAAIDPYPLGVFAGEGANNLGLLVSVCGNVTQRDRLLQFFYIDDGAVLQDGTQTETSLGVFEPSVGVRIKADPTAYPAGSYIAVTGISSCFTDGGLLKRQVLPVASGIQKLKD